MQRLLGLLGAAGASLVLFAACGGKVVVESSGATGGGAGGAGGDSTSSLLDGPFSSVAVSSTSVGQGGSGGVTTGSGTSCMSCNAAASGPIIMQSNLCPTAQALYKDLFVCACAASGACATQCSATACIGQATPDVCTACLNDPGIGCGVELKNCLTDS